MLSYKHGAGIIFVEPKAYVGSSGGGDAGLFPNCFHLESCCSYDKVAVSYERKSFMKCSGPTDTSKL